MKECLGIDLGTTYTAVAVVSSGDAAPRVLPNQHGELLTPSVVWYRPDGSVVVGKDAKEQLLLGSQDVMSFGKREMGNPRYLFPAGGRMITPVDFSADILREVKAYAERALGYSVRKAVITVPAYFAAPQREDTLRAARAAGLRVVRIINEPAAAGLAFVRLRPADGIYLVYDLGGGTFDVAVLRVQTRPTIRVQMLAYAGDSYLGGRDFDERLTLAVREEVRGRHRLNLLPDPAAQNRWIVLSERHKIELSSQTEVRIPYDVAGASGEMRITRSAFETSCNDLLKRTELACNKALEHAFKIPRKDLTELAHAEALQQAWKHLQGVLLVGGSTRMPMVVERLRRLSGQEPRRDVHPDEAVACGAAWCALGAEFDEIVAHQMGAVMVSKDGKRWVNSCILPEGTPVEESRTQTFLAHARPHEEAHLELYLTQGAARDPNAQGCRILGRYQAHGIPRGSGKVEVAVTFRYNKNGTVEAQARVINGPQLRISNEPLDDVARFNKPPQATRPVPAPLQIALVLDHSGSMMGQKFEDARRAASEFLGCLGSPGSRLGIIGYGSKSWEICPLTDNTKQVRDALSRTQAINSGTRFQPALYQARKMLETSQGRRILLLVTDGQNEDRTEAVAEAETCRRSGIDVHTIGTHDADQGYLNQIGPARMTANENLGEAILDFGREIGGEELPDPIGGQIGDGSESDGQPSPAQEKARAPLPSLFDALAIDPKTPVEQLHGLLRQAQTRWSQQATQAGEEAAQARILLDQLPYFQQALTAADPQVIESERQRAVKRGQEVAARQRLRIDEALNNAAAQEGFLEPGDITRTARELGVAPSVVEAAARELALPIENQTALDFPTLEPAVWSHIAGNLHSLGYPDLYALLAAAPDTPPQELLTRVKTQRKRVQDNDGDTTTGRMRLDLLANAAELFGNVERQKRYDNSRELAKLEDCRPMVVAAAGPRYRLTREQQEQLFQRLAERNVPEAVAEAFLRLAARENQPEIILERRRSDQKYRAKVRCPKCQTPNEVEHQQCKNCGLGLRVDCPNCRRPNVLWARECSDPKCRFDLTLRPDADDLAYGARRQVRYGDWSEARRLAEEALKLWPRHEEAEQILEHVRQAETSREDLFRRIEELQSHNLHREALRLLESAPADERRQELGELSQQAEQKAMEVIANGDQLAQSGLFDRAYDCFEEAHRICADGEGQKRMQGCPPQPVPQVRCTVQRGHAVLDWDPTPSQFGKIEYLVRMMIGVAPQGPQDGTQVCCGPNLRVATALDPGAEVYFAVFAQRNGVPNLTPSLAGPVFSTPEVEELQAIPSSGSVTLRYHKPDKADRVEIHRCSPGGDILVPSGASAAIDSGLPDGQQVTYRVVAVYRGANKREYRSADTTIHAIPDLTGSLVTDLRLELNGGNRQELIARFSEPQEGAAQLFRSDRQPVLQAGHRLDPRDLHQLGEPISMTNPCEAKLPIAAGELVFVTPATLRAGTVVVGATRCFCRIDPVEDFFIRPVGMPSKFRAEFAWPAGVTAVTLLVRADCVPQGADDLSAMRRRVLLGKGRSAVDLDLGDAPSVHVAAFSEVEVNGVVYKSDEPVVRVVPVGSRRTVYYRLTPIYERDRRWFRWLRRSREPGRLVAVKVELAPDQATRLPRLGLYFLSGGRPLRIESNQWVGDVYTPDGLAETYGPDKALVCEVELPDNLPEGGFRVFPAPHEQVPDWRFIDVPSNRS